MALMLWRKDTAVNWASANPVLMEGEMALETDTRKYKQGDGVRAYKNLPYVNPQVVDQATTDATYAKIYTPSQRAATESINTVKSIINTFKYQEKI